MSKRRPRTPRRRHDEGVDLFDQYRTGRWRGPIASGTGQPSIKRVIRLVRDSRAPRPLRLFIAVIIGLVVLSWIVLVVSQLV